ncbi:DUF6455 family protein [Neoaquamicrobium sediminum]|uniref:DUF6455 family protein n=1 Tax=Neoaquamicrobium sediminum TaxID=1849104 RepID=UPI003613E753
MTMNILERMQTKLGQSSEVMARAGVRLFEGGYAAENDTRNAIWRCLLCRHGDDCRDWLAAGRTDLPDFCPNRGTYEKYVVRL